MDTNLKTICLNRSVLDFFEQHLTPESWMLEIGGGWSSRWFADRCRQLTVVETDARWRETIARELQGANCHMTIAPTIERVQGYGGVDIALVDCVEHLREQAARVAWECLAVGGWLVFDDAQRSRHRLAVATLKSLGVEQQTLVWQEGDIETARERVALAWRKP